MSTQLFPEFFLQCCDATDYIDFGNTCASTNNCYGDLRPGGAYYWFSWPARLGLSNDFLIYANFLLLSLSVFLSTRALLLINKQISAIQFKSPTSTGLMLGAASLIIHLVFFWPTIFTSLSDPPAALFFLNGCWLLLLSCQTSAIKKIFFLIMAGLFLGFSAWVRAFYFYPVLTGIFVCSLAALTTPHRNFVYVAILSAFIPLGFQFTNTYSQYGKWSYFNSDVANYVSNMHLTSTAIGYDTLLPAQSYFSQPQECQIRSGILASLQAGDYSSLFCLLGNRAAFYLATYRPVNYLSYHTKNQLFTAVTQQVGDEGLWRRSNLDVQADVAPDPQGGMTADKMTAQSAQQYVGTYVSPWLMPPDNTDYTFSVWLWSDNPANIQLAITRRSDGLVVASTMAAITRQPQRFSVSVKTSNADEYNVTIGSPPPVTGRHSGASPSAFYVWGDRLEESTVMTEYRGGTYIAQWVVLFGNADYTFSAWLWSDKPTDIQLAFTRTSDESVIATTMATVTSQPQRFSITGRTTNLGRYNVIIGSKPSGANVRFGASPFDSFYIWGSQLEEGTVTSEYTGFEPLVGSEIRDWHVWLLLANGMALILMFLYIILFRRIWLFEPAGLAVTAMACAVFAEALIIIPEQRFCIAFMVLIWLFTLGFAFTIVSGRHTQRLN